ncbi:hypothetical protein DENSPDRAFT_857972 [Dentipellis sp. KUC8613]|nr:hypothetical protein DENSPDRAFT_857972 [Dentipellis sp. KUC8613]
MSSHRVLVTYASPQSFLSSDQWKQIHGALVSQFPLRSIHWKPASRPSVRTIQELDVKLVPVDTVRDEHTSQVPSTLLDKPLLNLYIFSCEDTDAYRASVRKQIKDWHTIISQRKNQEWLIVQIIKADVKAAAGGFFQIKGSVIDKVRSDFNTDKRDRCVSLTWSSGLDNPAAWAELISKVKDGVLSSFDSAISLREDEVKRSESQRLMPGWNFCTFFILKESLATSFEGMSLFEDSLLQYDELEISFNHVLREKNLSWFGTLIILGPKDDSLPLLSIDKKPYRDLILANSISVFDFRIYLLARQCTLLWRLGKIADICRKANAFLISFGRRLREAEAILPRYFIESWTYSSALSTVDQADTWAKSHELDTASQNAFNASKAELLELARSQLDIVGVKNGHLPRRPPFSMALPAIPPRPQEAESPKSTIQTITKAELLSSLDDREAFFELYVALTNRAIDTYAKAGRRKFALKLHGSLAALDVHRGRLSTALQTFSSLPAHYGPHKWTSLESYMLCQAIETYARGDMSKDQQWANIALSFLKSFVGDLGKDLLMQEEDKTAYVTRIVDALKTVLDTLETDIIRTDHPALSIRIPERNARLADTQDGSYLDVSLRNRLPCDLPMDEITVTLIGRESERLQFRSDVQSLKPGNSIITLFCPTSSSGTYLIDSSEAKLSRLRLQWNHREPTSSRKASRSQKPTVALVRLARDLRALDIRLRRPRCLELGMRPKLLMTVTTGRNQLVQANLILSAPSGIQFKCADATLEDHSQGTLEGNDNVLTLKDVPEDSSVSILVPHSDATAFHAIQVNMSIEYNTQVEPSITRTLFLTSRVPTSLPVAVNVQDFFRGEKLFSKFTISTTSYQHIRLSVARLETIDGPAEGLTISGTSPEHRKITTITPARPANFLFRIESQHVRDSLRLCIKYRMLRDEVETVIEQTVDDILPRDSNYHSDRSVIIDRIVQALESDAAWVQHYGVTGELLVPAISDSQDGELDTTLNRLLEILRRSRPPDVNVGSWREIRIPVDVPLMNILAAARIRLLATPFSLEAVSSDKLPALYAGQPISALLTIRTSFHWGLKSSNPNRRYRMRFDIEEMVREWLVSGRKRGDFEATDGGVFTVPITLIALHHGELALPKVSVSPLPVAGEMTMGSLSLPSAETHQVHGAERVLVLPRGGRSTFVLGMGEGLD